LTPTGGEEQRQADLAQRQARAVRDLPHERAGSTERAEDEAHEQWTACCPELEGRPAGQRDRQQTQQHAERRAESERDRVDLAEGAIRVAEEASHLGHALTRGDDSNTLTCRCFRSVTYCSHS
jgi:hypothetical protein